MANAGKLDRQEKTVTKDSQGSGAEVKVDGEEAVLHITDQSVMFEKNGKISGFLRSAIQLVEPVGDAMVIAYAVGIEVKSVRVEPITAVASLLVPGPRSSSQGLDSTAAIDEVFEKLYRDARKDLEERLARVQEEPENTSLRLNVEEEAKYAEVSRQMVNIVGAKHGFDPLADDNPVSLWGLENQPHKVQLDVVKIYYVKFLRRIIGPRAETADVIISTEEVWPEDWERLLIKFKLSDRSFLTDKFKRYLESRWKYRPGANKPVLARS